MRHTFSLACATLLAFTLLAGCDKAPAPKAVRAPLPVETLTVDAGDQPRWITLLGQAEGGREVEVKAQVSGIIQKVAFTEGSLVKAGDVLYQIDPAPFEAKLKSAAANTRSAKATLSEAKTNYERTRALFEKGAKSRQDLDTANRTFLVASSTYNAAAATERDAAISLEWTTVRAPASGLVSDTQFNEGALITAQNSVLATITQHDDVRVVFAPSARTLDGADVTIANAVKLRDERGRTISGKLDYVAQSINPNTSTRLMRARLDEGSGLLPGDFVHVDLQIGVRPNAVRIPQKAVRQEPDGTYTVFLYKDGKARLQPVKLDRWDGPDWIATDGLAAGDRVITNQLLKLRDGSAVQPAQAAKTDK